MTIVLLLLRDRFRGAGLTGRDAYPSPGWWDELLVDGHPRPGCEVVAGDLVPTRLCHKAAV